MKVALFKPKKGELKAIVRSYDDLVLLSYIVEEGDHFTSYSRRKITVGDTSEIRLVKIGIAVENAKLTDSGLSVSGKIDFSSDESVPLHKYHTLDIKIKTGFALQKKRFLDFQTKFVLKSKEKSPRIAICVYEDGYAIFYRITNYSLRKVYELKENVSGKRFKNATREQFFKKLSQNISEEFKRTKWDLFIVAGSSIDNEELKRGHLKDLSGIQYETVSYAHTGLKELMNKGKINELLRGTQVSVQRSLIKEYINDISNGNVDYVYGIDSIRTRLSYSVPIHAILTRDFVIEHKDLIEDLDMKGAEVTLFSEKDESLDLLNGFGGGIVKFS
jgi:stalled ribosome rescue protein Dom34